MHQAFKALATAQTRAARTQAEAAAAAPYCTAWKKRFNPFNRKCLHCSRLRDACDWSRQSKTRAMQGLQALHLAEMMIVVTFMRERPGLIRVMGTRLLRYL